MADQKRVYYVITKSSWGGAQKYVYELAKEQIKRSPVTVIAGPNQFVTDSLFEKKLQEAGVEFMLLPNLVKEISFIKEIKIFFHLYSLFKNEQPDVVHLNSSKIGGLGSLAATAAGVEKIVFTAHGLPFFEDRRLISRVLIRVATYITMLFSHEVILINKREYEYVKKWLGVSHKLHLIYNAIPTIAFFDREKARKKLISLMPQEILQKAKKPETVWIFSIGELVDNKGYIHLLEGLRQLKKRYRFVFLHFGTGELEEKLKEEARLRGLKDDIVWFGFNTEASRFLKAADIFVQPSVKEGLSYVLLESAQAGIATIATRVGGTPEIITHREDGIVLEPKKPKLIKDALALLCTDEKLRKRYGEELQKSYNKNFSLQTMRTETFAAYNR